MLFVLIYQALIIFHSLHQRQEVAENKFGVGGKLPRRGRRQARTEKTPMAGARAFSASNQKAWPRCVADKSDAQTKE
jgi:hypothetical protein